jgi:hypothetical protein
MGLDNSQHAKFSDICSTFPLKPIKDDGLYRAAIEILDRLFALDDPRTPAESEYFQALVQLVCEYEEQTACASSSPERAGLAARRSSRNS